MQPTRYKAIPLPTFRPTAFLAWVMSAVFAISVLAAGSVSAQEMFMDTNTVDVADRLDRLERDIRTLNQQLSTMDGPAEPDTTSEADFEPEEDEEAASGGAANEPAGSLDRLMERLSSLEDEVRQTTGAMESVDHRVFQMESRLERLMGDLEYRLSRLEGNPAPGALPVARAAPGPASVSTLSSNSRPIVSATPGAAQRQPGVLGSISKGTLDAAMSNQEGGQDSESEGGGSAAAPVSSMAAAPMPKVLPQGSPKQQYQHAFNLLRQARYGDAEAAWKEFIEINAADKLSENARYWLGETYYVQGTKDADMYIVAAQMFLESYRAAPRGAKAVDSLFKLGKSMSSMDKKAEACAAYGKLRKEFDAIPPATNSLLVREVKRLNCK